MAGGHAGDLHDSGTVLELGAEAGVVVVLDRLVLVAHRDLTVTDHGAQRHRPLGDGGGEAAAAHLLDVTAQEFGEVRGVAADVGERARTRRRPCSAS